jgi:group I intron endonuclease
LIDTVFLIPPVDGIELLPRVPGIYCQMNRLTRQCNIGQSINIQQRCVQHGRELRTGTASNMRIRRDAERYGADVFFFFVLEVLVVTTNTRVKRDLNLLELFWVRQFQSHDERYGYNAEAGGYRTKSARFRDRERKLMRRNSEKYELLPRVDMYDLINPELLNSWVPGG